MRRSGNGLKPSARSGGIVRRSRMPVVLGAALCAVMLPSSAGATAVPHGPVRTAVNSNGTATAAASCPSSGSICFYDSQNFNNLLGWVTPSSCTNTYTLPWRNVAESVRNRTGCRAYLFFYCGNDLCYSEWMRPNSEDGTIAPLNAIDAVGFAAG